MSDRPLQAAGYNYTLADDARPAEIPAERETEVPPGLAASDDTTHPETVSESQSPLASLPSATEVKPQAFMHGRIFPLDCARFHLFQGALLGLIPMWNSAVFLAAAAVLGLLFILFPLRLQMVTLAITAGLIALPQMLYLSTGSGRAQMPRLLHWGYTLDHPTTENVLKYLGFTFGFKWVLIALALILAGSLQRRFFLAALSLIAVAFSFSSPSKCLPTRNSCTSG